jgi:hypothetical protein
MKFFWELGKIVKKLWAQGQRKIMPKFHLLNTIKYYHIFTVNQSAIVAKDLQTKIIMFFSDKMNLKKKTIFGTMK